MKLPTVYDSRITDRFEEETKFSLVDNLFLACYAGSLTYGTAELDNLNDIDMYAVVIPPKDRLLGLHEFDNIEFSVDNIDIKIYSLKRYIELLLKNNPNILQTLWSRDEDYMYRSVAFKRLITDYRKDLTTQKLISSLIGYSTQQLKRVTNLSTNDGAKRKELITKYGYDTKMAYHLIRLLRMANEVIETGQLIIYRDSDADELMEIKHGEWAYQKLMDTANGLLERVISKRDAAKLLDSPDEFLLNQFLIDTTMNHLLHSYYNGHLNFDPNSVNFNERIHHHFN